MSYAPLTPDLACAALRGAGIVVAPHDLEIVPREQRWLVRLPNDRIAWFAASEHGRELLAIERRVLRLLEQRCTFAAPRILFASDDFDVRSMVPGSGDPFRAYHRVMRDPELAARVGTAIGTLLAQQHTRIAIADVDGWLPRRPSWPEPHAWIRERLPRVIDDPALVTNANAVIEAYESTPVAPHDEVLVHTDVGFHNLGIDPATFEVHGIFDYEGAAWADRHHDFRYLVFEVDRDDVLDAALAVYEPATDRVIDRDRVLLYNAACAVTFLAYRDGIPPDQRWCGRTLAEDLRWSRHAIARALRP